MTAKQAQLSFEDALKELESIVSRMERADRSLEDSLADFERGIEIVKDCRKMLQEAELKVETLTEDKNGTPNSSH